MEIFLFLKGEHFFFQDDFYIGLYIFSPPPPTWLWEISNIHKSRKDALLNSTWNHPVSIVTHPYTSVPSAPFTTPRLF